MEVKNRLKCDIFISTQDKIFTAIVPIIVVGHKRFPVKNPQVIAEKKNNFRLVKINKDF